MTTLRARLATLARDVVAARNRWPWNFVPRIAALSLLVAATGFVGFQYLFSSFASYDDEGYVMLSLRTFFAGRPLYDDVFTQYGPAYYALQAAFHFITSLEVTHDVARWKTLGAWLVSAALAAKFMQRMGGNVWMSVSTFLMVFFHLDRLGLEPGHPQDLCIPALLGLLLLSTYWRSEDGVRWLPLAIGTLLGTIAMTKLNLGLFSGLSIALAGLTVCRNVRFQRTLFALGVAGATILPFVLLKRHAFTWGGAALPALLVVGIFGLATAARRQTSGTGSLWTLMTIGVATLTSAALFAGFALATGTSPGGLYWGLIGQHLGFAADCYSPPPLKSFALAWSALALAALWYRRSHDSLTGYLLLGCSATLILVVRQQFGDSFHPLLHGLYDRGGAGLLATIAPPLAYLLVERASPTCVESKDFSRWLLAWSVVLQPLAVIPIPGTQVAIATLPALLMTLLLVGDGMERWCRYSPTFQAIQPLAVWRAFVSLAMLVLICRGWTSWERRSGYESLALPGATTLRLPATEVERLRTTVARLRETADTFVTMPSGFDSLYLWTQLPPPTGHNVTVWDVLLDDARQEAVIKALRESRHPRVVVYTDWPPPYRPHAPLVEYLRREFTHREAAGVSEIWARNPSAN